MKCKNIECDNETIGNRVYCSLSCRNVYVNKHLRNYEKCSNTFKEKRKQKEYEYLKNPKICIRCNKIIPFNKRFDNNNFCSHSCSASALNGSREYIWSDKIRNSIHKYLIEKGIKKEGQIGVYENQCFFCGITFLNKRKFKKYCSVDCRRQYQRRNMDEYQKYRLDSNFKFNLADYPNEFDFVLIDKYGWYSPSNKKDNLNGVSRDHMLSVRDGFELKIDPKLISHPANCRLIKHTDNIGKNKKSILTEEELLERIKKFEEKYEQKLN